MYIFAIYNHVKRKLRSLSPRANYAYQAAAACRRI
jgi:hypothetical protein